MTAPPGDIRTGNLQDLTTAWFTIRLGNVPSWNEAEVIGRLSTSLANAGFATQLADQTIAWGQQLAILRQTALALLANDPSFSNWVVALEYEIPRRARRIDTVLLTPSVVIVLEFKIGATSYTRADLWQAEDYALDLRDFHQASAAIPIKPILLATNAPQGFSADERSGVWCSNATDLPDLLMQLSRTDSEKIIDPKAWLKSGYRPTPTIVEAARRVFAGHNVRDLSHAYADNLTRTTEAIAHVIRDAKANKRRVICFITGVPGSGKTLAGLTAMQDARTLELGPGTSAFMSGNVPLVKVLRHALVRDQVPDGRPRKGARKGQGPTRKAAMRKMELLIQNVHKFIREYGVDKLDAVPPEHVIAFDEAQRAWHAAKLSNKLKRKVLSEPDIVLDIMSRPADWSVVVALVGGGQEIHDGEAGLEEWGRAIRRAAIPWEVVVTPEALQGGTSVAGHQLFAEPFDSPARLQSDPAMHLSVSVRSPKAQRLAEWVNAVLSLDAITARDALKTVQGFRVVMTRNLKQAREWLGHYATGALRAGLLASSGALRLRPEGLELDTGFHNGFPIEHWFLGSRHDFRSSHSLEVAMTEFECQGLELDYVGLCWGNDFVVAEDCKAWVYRRLRGANWQSIGKDIARQYLRNKYRVLMTRAREGLIIWVPQGDATDPTRAPEPFDRTAGFLRGAGVLDLASDQT